MRWPDAMPLNVLVLPLLLGSLLLGPRQLPWFVVAFMAALMVALSVQPEFTVRPVLAVAILFLLSFIILLTSFRRSRLGVAGALGESMLVDLRDRILGQGGIPELPDGLVRRVRAAVGGRHAVRRRLRRRGPAAPADRLEVVVVDVSGKGEQAAPVPCCSPAPAAAC